MTMNKGSKMKAGWLRILKNEKMLLSHTRNANNVNRVRASVHSDAALKLSSQCHSENTKKRLNSDEKAIHDKVKCLQECGSDPFDVNTQNLGTLHSGLLAPEELVNDFETAHSDGEKLVISFFSERMFSSTKSFDATISRNARQTFAKMSSGKIIPNSKTLKSAAMESKAMADVISLASKSKVKIDIQQIFQHRVTEECLSLFYTNGKMVKVQKLKLVECLNMVPLTPTANYTALIDMGFIWRVALPVIFK
jgi:serine/threonine protein kinase